MAHDTLLEPKASDLNQKKTFLFAYEDEFCAGSYPSGRDSLEW